MLQHSADAEPDEDGPGIEICDEPDDVFPLDVPPPPPPSDEPDERGELEGDALADALDELRELDEDGVGGGPLEPEPDALDELCDALADALADADRLDEPSPPPVSQHVPPVKTGRPL